jgi:acetyl esterase/lipase
MRQVLAILTVCAGCGLAGLADCRADSKQSDTVKSGGNFDVRVVSDVKYYDGSDADPVKHKLDLYLPVGQKDFPVLFFVHGGAWRSGDKKYILDVYGNIGRAFARNGIGTVVTNYRLSPKVQHPTHIQDVAKAFAWTHKHIAEYGGRPDQIFVCGHSAGGHLVALLATDEEYLKAEKLSLGAIKGAIPVSGVYRIPPGKLFSSAFTDKDEIRQQASPQTHVHGQHPPFLVLYADKDFPTCDKMSEDFCKALQKCKCDACSQEIKERDHLSIVIRIGNEEDPATQSMFEFIAKHSGLKLTEKPRTGT